MSTWRSNAANGKDHVLRGLRWTIGARFELDSVCSDVGMPPAPLAACRREHTGQYRSPWCATGTMMTGGMPVAYGHQEVWVRGYVHEVPDRLRWRGHCPVIATFLRTCEDLVFEPLNYLALAGAEDRRPRPGCPTGRLEAAAKRLPACLRLLEAGSMGKAGKREYVQVLRRSGRRFALAEVHGAVRDALRLGAIGYDAVKHLVLSPCRAPTAPELDLDVYPYLPKAEVRQTSAASYMSLLDGAAP